MWDGDKTYGENVAGSMGKVRRGLKGGQPAEEKAEQRLTGRAADGRTSGSSAPAAGPASPEALRRSRTGGLSGDSRESGRWGGTLTFTPRGRGATEMGHYF